MKATFSHVGFFFPQGGQRVPQDVAPLQISGNPALRLSFSCYSEGDLCTKDLEVHELLFISFSLESPSLAPTPHPQLSCSVVLDLEGNNWQVCAGGGLPGFPLGATCSGEV